MDDELHPVEAELEAADSLDVLAELNRESTIRLAIRHTTDAPWVRESAQRGELHSTVLGLFELVGYATPWPALCVLVVRGRADSPRYRAALLFLYQSPGNAGKWEVATRQAQTPAALEVPWPQYKGKGTGSPPTPFNGDWTTKGLPRPQEAPRFDPLCDLPQPGDEPQRGGIRAWLGRWLRALADVVEGLV
jgi:hypothetical protein